MQTSWDYVRNLESSLNLLRSDPQNAEAIETVHISAHSLKSQSLVMKYESLGHVCRDLEFYFRDIKDGKKTLTPETLAVLGEVIVGMKHSLSLIATEDREEDLTSLGKKVQAFH